MSGNFIFQNSVLLTRTKKCRRGSLLFFCIYLVDCGMKKSKQQVFFIAERCSELCTKKNRVQLSSCFILALISGSVNSDYITKFQLEIVYFDKSLSILRT